jgi:hypothetical protein
VLADPTYATGAVTNPHAHLAVAGVDGVDESDFAARQWAIIYAIEHHESGAVNVNQNGGTGEVPAGTPNGAGVPASFGRVQMIGTSELDLLDAHAAQAGHYGLVAAVPVLRAAAVAVGNHFDAAYQQVGVGGQTPAGLVAQIAAYAAANPGFAAATFLDARDLAHLFHTAQLLRKRNAEITANPAPPQPGSPPWILWRDARVAALAADADLAPSLAELGLAGDLRSFVVTQLRGEQRAAFATRALFLSPYGQRLRNAMTDNDGRFGRLFVLDNYQRVVNAALAQGVVLSRDDEARITMRIHNSGADGLAGYVQNPATAVNGYVNLVWPFYTDYVTNNPVP